MLTTHLLKKVPMKLRYEREQASQCGQCGIQENHPENQCPHIYMAKVKSNDLGKNNALVWEKYPEHESKDSEKA